MTANVSIIIEEKKDLLKVPNAALRFRLSEKAKQPQKGAGLWVLEGGKPKRIAVTTGISDGTFTELLKGEGGEGQEVIVESLEKPKTQAAPGPRMF